MTGPCTSQMIVVAMTISFSFSKSILGIASAHHHFLPFTPFFLVTGLQLGLLYGPLWIFVERDNRVKDRSIDLLESVSLG